MQTFMSSGVGGGFVARAIKFQNKHRRGSISGSGVSCDSKGCEAPGRALPG